MTTTITNLVIADDDQDYFEFFQETVELPCVVFDEHNKQQTSSLDLDYTFFLFLQNSQDKSLALKNIESNLEINA
jgi:hypothetical protein